MFWEIVLLVIGICGLWFSAELIIKSAKIISHKLKISDTFIGLTILSIGTTLPEMGTHLITSIKMVKENIDISGVAVGTNIGSNIIQITVILGLIGFFMTVRARKAFLNKDFIVMLTAIFVVWVFSIDGTITRLEGSILAISYLVYLWTLGSTEKLIGKIEHNHKKGVGFHLFIVFVGIALLLGASELAVDSLVSLSDQLGVTETLLGALVLGIGTALPELAAALAALKEKSSGMSLGVLIGSNITNPLFGLGIGSIISTYSVARSIFWFDLPFWFITSLVLLFFLKGNNKLEKKESAVLMAFYIVYVIVRIKLFA